MTTFLPGIQPRSGRAFSKAAGPGPRPPGKITPSRGIFSFAGAPIVTDGATNHVSSNPTTRRRSDIPRHCKSSGSPSLDTIVADH